MVNIGQSEVRLPVAAWSAWAPGIDSTAAWEAWATQRADVSADGTPDLGFVAPMLRRRLSRGARMMLWVAQQCVGDRAAVRTVFASRHGELNRTVPMLRELARGGELSPTDFSLSVHNAAAGVYSIVRHDRSAHVSVAAGEESFAYGLLDAAMQFQLRPELPVLVVYADEPVPAEYRGFVGKEAPPHAVALLLSGEGKNTIRMVRRPAGGSEAAAEPLSLTFLRAWAARQSRARWVGEYGAWEWSMAYGD